ncbi:MAG TPA: 6-phosphogluconolactonase [Rhizomicrobium sp.]|nr:6-phosphogluconolactonase [Rhizomicrobium sp.]
MASGSAIVEADAGALARRAAGWLVARMTASQGAFRLALSGGETPRLLYRLLAEDPLRGRIPWSRLELYWGDERFVPWSSPDSNYNRAREEWLSRVDAPAGSIHPIPTDTTPDDCAARYETTLRARAKDAPCLFELVLLGLGADGHTASLLPGQPVLEERARLVAAVPRGREEPRITLTYPALESSAAVAFLVTGAAKRDVVARARRGDESLPAGRLRPRGETVWFLDEAAAGA